MPVFIQGQAAKQGKSRRKTERSIMKPTVIVTGSRIAHHGVSTGRSGAIRGNNPAGTDQFGFVRGDKYDGLGPRCKENIRRAIDAGFQYQGQSATTEEQVCFGELLRRGFTLGLGTSPRSFQPQSPIAGSVVDFEVWLGAERHALRPMNLYWHGTAEKKSSDDLKGQAIVAHGYVLDDIWSSDSLLDGPLERKFDQFFGRGY